LIDTILFYVFALLVLGGAVLTVTRRSAIHSAIFLIVSLIGVAGLYLLQKAEFLFAVQIVLYVGGIMVLFLFVIMLVTWTRRPVRSSMGSGGGALALAGGAQVFYFITGRRPSSAKTPGLRQGE
jgi:NADH-quinone oxidoreductase subunit J